MGKTQFLLTRPYLKDSLAPIHVAIQHLVAMKLRKLRNLRNLVNLRSFGRDYIRFNWMRTAQSAQNGKDKISFRL